jgi:hypothetical protein
MNSREKKASQGTSNTAKKSGRKDPDWYRSYNGRLNGLDTPKSRAVEERGGQTGSSNPRSRRKNDRWWGRGGEGKFFILMSFLEITVNWICLVVVGGSLWGKQRVRVH